MIFNKIVNFFSFSFILLLTLSMLSSCKKDEVAPIDTNQIHKVLKVTAKGKPSDWLDSDGAMMVYSGKENITRQMREAELIYAELGAETSEQEISAMQEAFDTGKMILAVVHSAGHSEKITRIFGVDMGEGIYLCYNEPSGDYRMVFYNHEMKNMQTSPSQSLKMEIPESFEKYLSLCAEKDAEEKKVIEAAKKDKEKMEVAQTNWEEYRKKILSAQQAGIPHSVSDNEMAVHSAVASQIRQDIRDAAQLNATKSENSTRGDDQRFRDFEMEFKCFYYIKEKDQVFPNIPQAEEIKDVRFIVQMKWVARLLRLERFHKNNIIEFYNEGIGTIANIVLDNSEGNYFRWLNCRVRNIPSNIRYYVEPLSHNPGNGISIANFAPSTIPPTVKEVKESSAFSITVNSSGPSDTLNVGREVKYIQQNAGTEAKTNALTRRIEWMHDYRCFNQINDLVEREMSFIKEEAIGAIYPFQYNPFFSKDTWPEIFKKAWPLRHSVIYTVEKDIRQCEIKAGIDFELTDATASYRGAFWLLT